MDPNFPADDVTPIPTPRETVIQLIQLGFWMFLASQLVAGAVYYGFNWRAELSLAQATKEEATLLAVNPSTYGYRVQIAYPVEGKVNRTSVLVRNPPNIRIGEKLDVYVDPTNFWKVEIPGPPAMPLYLVQMACAGFAFFFYFFMALGAIATSTAVHSPRFTAKILRFRKREEKKSA